jgi:hypothetical protein
MNKHLFRDVEEYKRVMHEKYGDNWYCPSSSLPPVFPVVVVVCEYESYYGSIQIDEEWVVMDDFKMSAELRGE